MPMTQEQWSTSTDVEHRAQAAEQFEVWKAQQAAVRKAAYAAKYGEQLELLAPGNHTEVSDE